MGAGRGVWEEWKLEPNKTLRTARGAARPCAATSALVVVPVPTTMLTKVLLILLGMSIILPSR